ncbi:MAG: sporulation protein [Bacillota bacterium]
MSFLKKMMASVGIGSARVNTVLEDAQVRAGEPLRGTVYVKGGSVEQQIDTIYIHLMTQYRREVENGTARESISLGHFPVVESFTLAPGENREFPFEVLLPDETPVSVGHTQVWLKTGLDIAMAVDPGDTDYLEVLPHRSAEVVFVALDRLGFRLRQAECEYSRRLGRSYPFVQQFEFVPVAGQFRGHLDELELILFPHAGGLDLWMEVDRRARGFAGLLEEALDADEARLHVEFEQEHIAQGPEAVAGYLAEIIAQHAR